MENPQAHIKNVTKGDKLIFVISSDTNPVKKINYQNKIAIKLLINYIQIILLTGMLRY